MLLRSGTPDDDDDAVDGTVAVGFDADDVFDGNAVEDAADVDAGGLNDDRLLEVDAIGLDLLDPADFFEGIIMPSASAKLVPIELSISSMDGALLVFLSAFSTLGGGDSVSTLLAFEARCFDGSSAALRFFVGDCVNLLGSTATTLAGAWCSCDDPLPLALLRLDL